MCEERGVTYPITVLWSSEATAFYCEGEVRIPDHKLRGFWGVKRPESETSDRFHSAEYRVNLLANTTHLPSPSGSRGGDVTEKKPESGTKN